MYAIFVIEKDIKLKIGGKFREIGYNNIMIILTVY